MFQTDNLCGQASSIKYCGNERPSKRKSPAHSDSQSSKKSRIQEVVFPFFGKENLSRQSPFGRELDSPFSSSSSRANTSGSESEENDSDFKISSILCFQSPKKSGSQEEASSKPLMKPMDTSKDGSDEHGFSSRMRRALFPPMRTSGSSSDEDNSSNFIIHRAKSNNPWRFRRNPQTEAVCVKSPINPFGGPPDAPIKSTKEIEEILEKKCLVLKATKQAKKGLLEWNGRTLILKAMNKIGTFHELYKVTQIIGEPLTDDPNVREFVVKCTHSWQLFKTRKGRSSWEAIIKVRQQHYDNGWEQRGQMIEAGIPVIPVFNHPSKDCFWLMPLVNSGFPLEKIPESGPLTEEAKDLIRQLADICKKSIDQGINIDAHPENFYLQDDGTLAVLDFREVKQDSSIPKMYVRKDLPKFLKGNAEAIEIFKKIVGDDIYVDLEPLKR